MLTSWARSEVRYVRSSERRSSRSMCLRERRKSDAWNGSTRKSECDRVAGKGSESSCVGAGAVVADASSWPVPSLVLLLPAADDPAVEPPKPFTSTTTSVPISPSCPRRCALSFALHRYS